MTSLALGRTTSPAVEVTNISSHGIWVLTHDKELFLSYEDFPWFKERTVKSITNVREETPGHYYWPDLDVDLSEEIIENPQRFVLEARDSHLERDLPDR